MNTGRGGRAPLFSVIIPTFNRSDLLPFAITSVLHQSFQDFEIVVCDNFSEDATPEAVDALADERLRYVRTPRHFVIADNWEFARSHATGSLIVVLADDDVLVPTALQRFADSSSRYASDFLFSSVAEYRDKTFPGNGRNTLLSYGCSGKVRPVKASEFLEPLFAFQPRYNMHPSAFVFGRSLAASIADKVGRFFQTNGVEYCAWPLAAAQASCIVHIDAPLIIAGRTGKSWGANVVLGNPGRKRINQFIADVDQQRQYAPLHNFTFCNLIAEGILTAKHLLPAELGGFNFNEVNYLLKSFEELSSRRALGVEVSNELNEVIAYSARYPSLLLQLTQWRPGRLRSLVGDLGVRRLLNYGRDRWKWRGRRDAGRVRAGDAYSSFVISGRDFGFANILECAKFLDRLVPITDTPMATTGAD